MQDDRMSDGGGDLIVWTIIIPTVVYTLLSSLCYLAAHNNPIGVIVLVLLGVVFIGPPLSVIVFG